MNVNYEYYRLFYYVCKYHSITRAANVLRMSQPNVTRALNRRGKASWRALPRWKAAR